MARRSLTSKRRAQTLTSTKYAIREEDEAEREKIERKEERREGEWVSRKEEGRRRDEKG